MIYNLIQANQLLHRKVSEARREVVGNCVRLRPFEVWAWTPSGPWNEDAFYYDHPGAAISKAFELAEVDGVTRVLISGGFDAADSDRDMAEGDYTPFASEFEAVVCSTNRDDREPLHCPHCGSEKIVDADHTAELEGLGTVISAWDCRTCHRGFWV